MPDSPMPNLAVDATNATNEVSQVLSTAATDVAELETFWQRVSPDILHHVTTLAAIAGNVAVALSHKSVPEVLQLLAAASFGRSAGVVYNKK